MTAIKTLTPEQKSEIEKAVKLTVEKYKKHLSVSHPLSLIAAALQH